MKRRMFLHTSASAVLLASLGTLGRADESAALPELVRDLIRANDARIPALLASQTTTPGAKGLGGVLNEYGFPTASGAAGLILALSCAVVTQESKYHESPEVIAALRLALPYLLSAQHEDGTIDYFATNFRSPPDTAFVIELMGPACALLRRSRHPELVASAADATRFVLRAADGLVVGGVHTPNHRWIVCSALAWAHSLNPDPRYLKRVDQWMAEKIDIDPDGQYTEKSTTVYSPAVDRALITVARLLKRPELFDPVRRNLDMTLYYLHPDGEVVTEASLRQDRNQRTSPARYYYAYRTLALLDGDGRFAAVARRVERTEPASLTGELANFLVEPDLARPLPADAPLPTDYARVFSYSALARIRRGQISATVLGRNTTVLTYRKGAAILEALRLATAFFGKGQFTSETLEVREGTTYVLRQVLTGPYFQPLSDAQIASGEHVKMAPNGTLANMGKAIRAESNVQHLEAVVTVTESAGRFTLAFSIEGTEGVPVAIELAFRPGGKLEGVEAAPGLTDAFLLRSGQGRYRVGDDVIEFGPGFVDHTYTQIRGALPRYGGPTVYLTGFTPFRQTLTLS